MSSTVKVAVYDLSKKGEQGRKRNRKEDQGIETKVEIQKLKI